MGSFLLLCSILIAIEETREFLSGEKYCCRSRDQYYCCSPDYGMRMSNFEPERGGVVLVHPPRPEGFGPIFLPRGGAYEYDTLAHLP